MSRYDPHRPDCPVRKALDYADGAICRHDSTHRGGVLWTICDDCGAKWADDEGGFKPSAWPAILDAAYDALQEPDIDPRLLSEATRMVDENWKGEAGNFALTCLLRGMEIARSGEDS